MNTILPDSCDPSDRLFQTSTYVSFIARDTFRSIIPASFRYGYSDLVLLDNYQMFLQHLHPYVMTSDIYLKLKGAVQFSCQNDFFNYVQANPDHNVEMYWVSSHSCSKDHLRHVSYLWSNRTGPRFKCFLLCFRGCDSFYELHFSGNSVEIVSQYTSTLQRSLQPLLRPFQDFYTHKQKELKQTCMDLSDVQLFVSE